MSRYIGITIGPIIDTLMMAHSPAASNMFSSLTEKMCELLSGDGCEIISPHYNSGDKYDDGIGRYHDRIIANNVVSPTEMTEPKIGIKFIIKAKNPQTTGKSIPIIRVHK